MKINSLDRYLNGYVLLGEYSPVVNWNSQVMFDSSKDVVILLLQAFTHTNQPKPKTSFKRSKRTSRIP